MRIKIARALATAALAASLGLGAAHAGQLDDLLGRGIKAVGIKFVVQRFGGEINKAINTLLNQRGIRYEGVTKVVPIVSLGSGAYMGAAQIQGEESLVRQARGVVQVEVPLGRVRGKALVPVNSLTPGRGYKRIRGTGVTAVIDFRL